jgi:protein-tyrosine phosphatase
MAGVSRSATIVIAYLMKKKHLSFKQAFEFVKIRRVIVWPNDGFIE